MMACKSARETTSDKALPKSTATSIPAAAAKSSSASEVTSVCAGPGVAVSFLPRAALGHVYYPVWASTDVKKSPRFRYQFPELCNEDRNAQTKQIEINASDLVLRLLWMEIFFFFSCFVFKDRSYLKQQKRKTVSG